MNGVIGAGVILSVMGGGVFYNVLAKGIPAASLLRTDQHCTRVECGTSFVASSEGMPSPTVPLWSSVAHLRSGINFVAWPTWIVSGIPGATHVGGGFPRLSGRCSPFPRPGRRPHVQHPFLGGVWVCAGVEWLVPKSPVAFHSLGLLPVCPLSKFSAGTGIGTQTTKELRWSMRP